MLLGIEVEGALGERLRVGGPSGALVERGPAVGAGGGLGGAAVGGGGLVLGVSIAGGSGLAVAALDAQGLLLGLPEVSIRISE